MKTSFTLCLLLSFFLANCKKESIRVGLLPFSGINKNIAAEISGNLSKTYGVKVYILPHKMVPKRSFVNIKTPRYRADSLIKIMKHEMLIHLTILWA